MKEYIIFAISFIFLFFIFQTLTSFIVTSLYNPNIEEAWNMSNLSKTTVITSPSNSFIITILIAFLSATIAFFLSKKNNHKK